MHASGLPELYGNAVGGCTYEGDNIVLLLQVARFVIYLFVTGYLFCLFEFDYLPSTAIALKRHITN